jgi:predicted nucleic acid-binding protein
MIYVDTSVLVALFLPEPHTPKVRDWYAQCKDPLASCRWVVTEFSSALSLKCRSDQITDAQAEESWHMFKRLCQHDLQLLSPDAYTFEQAAELIRDHPHGLRSGDGLHLSAALQFKAKKIASLDVILTKNAQLRRLPLVSF